ncbi:hypothetical protein [Pseudomonas sp. BIGb0164]|uniref:hypothetical protein n=1 Tax=Pseudomonas sp. BIGb0164 TaxID=2940605 RepID=UPI0021684741|nr:hypothetical protein [Pseudomonas sp. BIGb0164]MCS4246206.1 hypothetical protein [Pseudomonas sp. BIGb0164]
MFRALHGFMPLQVNSLLASVHQADIGEEMQHSKKSIFKWLVSALMAIVGAVLLAPFSKWGEEQLNPSILSPLIDGVWSWIVSVGSWLGQPIPTALWVQISIFIWAVVMSTLFVRALKAAAQTEITNKAIFDSADRQMHEACTTIDHQSNELEKTKGELVAACSNLSSVKTDLKAAQATIADLRTPKEKPLNEHQRRALAAIAFANNSGEVITAGMLCKRLQLNAVQADNAVDVLSSRGLVEEYSSYGMTMLSLSAKGRAYVLEPDFDSSFL